MANTKLVYKYYAQDIGTEEWKSKYMLFDGWNGHKVYDPSGQLIGKAITKGVATDMARSHYRWSNDKALKEDDSYIKFFEANYVRKHMENEPSVSNLTELELMTHEEELENRIKYSQLFREAVTHGE